MTHFNLVHVDCHMAALRLQRGRDEWESAMLQNANTRCNGLLPLWGPQVPESAFASSLARHNTYLYEATRHRDIGYQSTVHDLKLLLLRFAQDKSFSSESGGGGKHTSSPNFFGTKLKMCSDFFFACSGPFFVVEVLKTVKNR